MRLNSGSSIHNLMEIKDFSKWLLKMGDGDLRDDDDGESIITNQDRLLIKESDDLLLDMVDFVFLNILDHISDPTFFKERVILTPKLANVVAMLNEHLMTLILGEENTYLSLDNILKQDGNSTLEDVKFSP
ncbi:uncharacterized protein LOC133300168 [Gastrolobium bilobum]|uniref:uncharacterized protein LOC133300168 n=1 Tax=Gastrolobium bilobum TaxID=150636 RepID=UPI002AB2A747|nr:uncharacterized protein LOC133300168 [Gastrolobium bilobum]